MKKIILLVSLFFSLKGKSQMQNYYFYELQDTIYHFAYQAPSGVMDMITGYKTDWTNIATTELRVGALASFTESDPTSIVSVGANNTLLKTRIDSLFSTTEFTTRARAAFTAGSGINISNGVISTSIASPVVTSIASGARNFNQAYQLSTTKYSDIRVSSQISCSLSLAGGQSGQIFLEYSADGSTGWTLAGLVPSSNTGTLTVGLNTVQISGGQISTPLPPGYYWRLRTNNVTGTPTYTFTGGVEVIY